MALHTICPTSQGHAREKSAIEMSDIPFHNRESSPYLHTNSDMTGQVSSWQDEVLEMTIIEKKPIRRLIIVMTLFAGAGVYCFFCDIQSSSRLWAIAAVVFSEAYLLYLLGYNSRIIHIGKHGIFVTWFWKKTFYYGWSGFLTVQEEYVISSGYATHKGYNAIICSKIPVKRGKVYQNGKTRAYVSAQWVSQRPKDVIEIDLEFLEEGQYEEFWTYVPDELKHSS